MPKRCWLLSPRSVLLRGRCTPQRSSSSSPRSRLRFLRGHNRRPSRARKSSWPGSSCRNPAWRHPACCRQSHATAPGHWSKNLRGKGGESTLACDSKFALPQTLVGTYLVNNTTSFKRPTSGTWCKTSCWKLDLTKF